jgi:hypothetical protein
MTTLPPHICKDTSVWVTAATGKGFSSRARPPLFPYSLPRANPTARRAGQGTVYLLSFLQKPCLIFSPFSCWIPPYIPFQRVFSPLNYSSRVAPASTSTHWHVFCPRSQAGSRRALCWGTYATRYMTGKLPGLLFPLWSRLARSVPAETLFSGVRWVMYIYTFSYVPSRVLIVLLRAVRLFSRFLGHIISKLTTISLSYSNNKFKFRAPADVNRQSHAPFNEFSTAWAPVVCEIYLLVLPFA